MRVTEADIKAWEKYGPAIFHGDMTGPEVLARVRIAALEEAACVADHEKAHAEEQYRFWRDQDERSSMLWVEHRMTAEDIATAIRNLAGEE